MELALEFDQHDFCTLGEVSHLLGESVESISKKLQEAGLTLPIAKARGFTPHAGKYVQRESCTVSRRIFKKEARNGTKLILR